MSDKQYSGRLIDALVKQRKAPSSIRVRSAHNAEISIVKRYGEIDPHTEYNYRSHGEWKKVSDLGSHKLVTKFKIQKPIVPTQESPQKLLPKKESPLKLKEGRKTTVKQESPKHEVIVTPAPQHKPKYRVGQTISKEFHQRNSKGRWVENKITHTIERFNPETRMYTIKITELLSKGTPKREHVHEDKLKAFTKKMVNKADELDSLYLSE